MKGFVALCAVLAVAGVAGAVDEADATHLRPDVEAAWHEPAVVTPHSQWQGFLRLAEGSNVTAASFQICRVGEACFAPPQPATLQPDGRTWRFDTAQYVPSGNGGNPVDYQAGWRIGVRWILTQGDGSTAVLPAGLDEGSPQCMRDPTACAESHYIAFDMPPAAPTKPAGGVQSVLLAGTLVGSAMLAGRRAGRP